MSRLHPPTERFGVYCRHHGIDPDTAHPGTDYVRWIRARRREFGSHAASDSEAFLAWLAARYPPADRQGSLAL